MGRVPEEIPEVFIASDESSEKFPKRHKIPESKIPKLTPLCQDKKNWEC